MKIRMDSIFPAGLFGLFFLVGFGMLGYGLWSVARSAQAAAWPTTPGMITQLSLAERADNEGATTYEVKVNYSYAVKGAAYEGSRLAFGYGGSGGRAAHEEILQKLKDAKQVAVRYDPHDPAVSCLSYGVHRSIQFVLAFAATWLAFIIGMSSILWLSSRSDDVLLDHLQVRHQAVDGTS
jgi:hypothetical protein